MTAIALFRWFDPERDAREPIARMVSALRPYGVEDEAIRSDGAVALGRTLYRTLPEDAHDRQPVAVAGGTGALVADIRLDNRAELAEALGLAPTAAARLADSAVLAHAWDRWGEDCVDRLVGDFAFIVWDRNSRSVFCARSPSGNRPLFYHCGQDFIAIASMPKGLFALAEVPRTIDADYLGAFLANLPTGGDGNPFAERSFYTGIAKLPAGASLDCALGPPRIRSHWSPESALAVRYRRDADYVERANELFDQAVAARLRAIGPIGSQVSSGLDSTTVSIFAATRLAAAGERLHAFTAVPRPGEAAALAAHLMADEGPLAAMALAPFGNIEHHRIAYPSGSLLDTIERCLRASDELVRNPCNLPWIEGIEQAAQARGIRVMLTGATGNATLSFEGRARFRALMLERRYAAWLREALLYAHRRRGAWWRLGVPLHSTISAARRRDYDAAARPIWTELGSATPLNADFIARHGLEERRSERLRDWSDQRLMSTGQARMMRYGDAGPYSAGAIMAYGIDYRDPTGDRRLVEFCVGLPLDQYLKHGEDRRLVRRMMRGRLPDAILHGRVRGLQGVGWLANMHAARAAIIDEVQGLRQVPIGPEMFAIDELEALARSIPGGAPADLADIARFRHKLLHGVAAARFIRHVGGGDR
jgi:asparagine synthase (glutamine-hydrolysing)